MSWEGGFFIDSTLPFGLRSAPKIFAAVADAVEWIARYLGVRFVIHYLDDFLLVGAPLSPECDQALQSFLQLFKQLGLPVSCEEAGWPNDMP